MTECSCKPAMPLLARIYRPVEIPSALQVLKIGRRRPVLVSVGGAGGMSLAHLTNLAEALEPVVRALDDWGAAVLDGGTNVGVMKVVGQARNAVHGRFPLVGVAAEGTVILPGAPARRDAASLEPHHTHIVLVPGNTWGDESPWLARIATWISDDRPSVTLVVNGGGITYRDIDHSLQAGRPVIVVAGTGRAADAIAAAREGRRTDSRAMRIAASASTRIVKVSEPDAIFRAVEAALGLPSDSVSAS